MLRVSVGIILGVAMVAGSLSGCASQQPQQPVTRQVKVTTANVEEVQRAGYKIVNKDGEKLYCRTDLITGSHVRTKTQCLTEKELYDQMEETRRTMDRSLSSHQPGPPGS